MGREMRGWKGRKEEPQTKILAKALDSTSEVDGALESLQKYIVVVLPLTQSNAAMR